MRSLVLILAGLTVAACVPATPVARAPSDATRISDVAVRPDQLSITMSDGARCVAARPAGETGGWSGTTDNCGYALPYDVIFRQGGNPARFAVEESFGTVAPDGALRPRAEVYVRDVDGVRKQFIRPLGENVRFTPAT
jgi:hypothetical protein